MAADAGGGVCSTCDHYFSSFDLFWGHVQIDGRASITRRRPVSQQDDYGNVGGCNVAVSNFDRSPAEGAEEQEDEPTGEGAMEQRELSFSSVFFQTSSRTPLQVLLSGSFFIIIFPFV